MNRQKNGNSRGIEWTDYTWNPIAGCQHGCSWSMPDGSTSHCYAGDVAKGLARQAYPDGFAAHYWKPESLSEASRLLKPSRVFVGSMADVFGHWVPTEQIQVVLDVCRANLHHQFQFLTKNAPRLRQFVFPKNCWVGASVPPSWMNGAYLTPDQQRKMLITTLAQLAVIKAPVRWMSIEPLSWDVAPVIEAFGRNLDDKPVLDWVVIGAASNGRKYYQPDAGWVRRLVRVCDEQGVKIFFKGNLKGNAGIDCWREEFPKVS